MDAAKPLIKLRSWDRIASSVSSPVSLQTLPAREPIRRPPNQGQVPSVRSTGSHESGASIVPKPPGDAPITATGRLPNTFGISGAGRDSQSIAFFDHPGRPL